MSVPYQLPNGKTVFLRSADLLDLTDEDIQKLMADDSGSFIDDPMSSVHFEKFDIVVGDLHNGNVLDLPEFPIDDDVDNKT